MLADSIDGFLIYKMVKQTGRVGRQASRIMGWVIVFLAYGVAFYDGLAYFFPKLTVDFELVGIISFLSLLVGLAMVSWSMKGENPKTLND